MALVCGPAEAFGQIAMMPKGKGPRQACKTEHWGALGCRALSNQQSLWGSGHISDQMGGG